MKTKTNVIYYKIIVHYTVKDEIVREAVNKIIKEDLNGEWINESAYSVGGEDPREVKRVLIKGTENLEFQKGDFLGVLYSPKLVDVNSELGDSIKEDIIKGERRTDSRKQK